LVCLYSRAFFKSVYCGRVWRAFLTRLAIYGKLELNSPHVLPVLWGPPSDNPKVLPKVARDLEFDHSRLGALYYEYGLRFLLDQAVANRGNYKQAYDACIESLATLVLQVAQTDPLPFDPHIPSLEAIESVFPEPGHGEKREGAEIANFIFFVARKMEISTLRDPGGGQVRSLLDKRVGAAVTVAPVTGALRAVKSRSISSQIAFS
jgi:hypothetical protein